MQDSNTSMILEEGVQDFDGMIPGLVIEDIQTRLGEAFNDLVPSLQKDSNSALKNI